MTNESTVPVLVQKCGEVKTLIGTQTHLFLIIGSPTAIQI
jgi:hypothetical protein